MNTINLEKMENNKLILVYYINVSSLDMHEIGDYMDKVRNKINIDGFDGHSIFVPVTTHESKIECINPRYITEEKLINEHTSMLKELNKELNHNVEELKSEKNG